MKHPIPIFGTAKQNRKHSPALLKRCSVRSLSFALLLITSLFFLTSCSRTASSVPSVSETGFYFDTVVTITLYGTEDSALIQDCFSKMADYEKLFSRTLENSEVWKINHSNGTPVKLSEETASLIKTALSYCKLSKGRFDITIAPVTDLWNFKGEAAHSLPDPDQLKEALSHVNYETILFNGNTITLKDPKAAIDLGGIAKGYIADQLKEFLLSKGITSGLIDLGGNLLTIGTKPDGSSWKLGIRKPFAQNSSELSATIAVNDLALVTSGTYERYFEQDGILYHHILDKTTGYSVNNGLSSVSILSPSAADCDALSTTCFLLGLEEGLALIETLENTEALFILNDGTLHPSSHFPE